MTAPVLRASLASLAFLWLACGGGTPPPPMACGQGDSERSAPPAFAHERELRVREDGLTDWAEVPLARAAVALRVSVPRGHRACVQLDTLEDPVEGAWVTPPASAADFAAYCVSCPQRVSVGEGGGFYVLPSGAGPSRAAERLRIRAALRDCETLLPILPGTPDLPSTLRLQVMPLAEPPEEQEGRIRLVLALTPGSPFFEDSARTRETLEEAVRSVNEALRPGRLRVEVARTVLLDFEGSESLTFSPGDPSAPQRVLAPLHSCSGERTSAPVREVPVVFTGCLREAASATRLERRPLGRVTHIPGGFATGEESDGIFLAGRHCDPEGALLSWPATTVARLLAHELGHFLGLYHSVEEDGTPDPLADTTEANAMYFGPLSATARGFSPEQFRVMRRHPMVSYPSWR
ncbi:hypothetical protein [Pyxidicoccus xibeiensis]|uniref:hypothetical protein n=1 Tax=Pyxidicoccus xibeiensis TaxID=2906759 RepID=UPI0020A77BD2|nr:hypothetical protein [Pyxidicoccus xibeiensis]MCP3143145.1 hypothetical protein [Pyxidicoccus xibeiensis]